MYVKIILSYCLSLFILAWHSWLNLLQDSRTPGLPDSRTTASISILLFGLFFHPPSPTQPYITPYYFPARVKKNTWHFFCWPFSLSCHLNLLRIVFRPEAQLSFDGTLPFSHGYLPCIKPGQPGAGGRGVGWPKWRTLWVSLMMSMATK